MGGDGRGISQILAVNVSYLGTPSLQLPFSIVTPTSADQVSNLQMLRRIYPWAMTNRMDQSACWIWVHCNTGSGCTTTVLSLQVQVLELTLSTAQERLETGDERGRATGLPAAAGTPIGAQQGISLTIMPVESCAVERSIAAWLADGGEDYGVRSTEYGVQEESAW
ncbi:hypothetical protein ASPZODRAFT_141443 [Penicilliopsis zonata CBS 506.65]|uniref:Uncharacterized protein n=1 Tax=Penicilliopsis zonata CBS 506.65 TaxID=1073090 RepID=A0A1L9SKZ2_9EURO|nr:hypothetical protein ASPZODRAFT_141443 [Penicilliopsis zonata CBS 506.65]OJJ47879.1 hypothetical protein ASPZODRAFT_141443 [Penicilliopsis zonata CBS 506.65]